MVLKKWNDDEVIKVFPFCFLNFEDKKKINKNYIVFLCI